MHVFAVSMHTRIVCEHWATGVAGWLNQLPPWTASIHQWPARRGTLELVPVDDPSQPCNTKPYAAVIAPKEGSCAKHEFEEFTDVSLRLQNDLK